MSRCSHFFNTKVLKDTFKYKYTIKYKYKDTFMIKYTTNKHFRRNLTCFAHKQQSPSNYGFKELRGKIGKQAKDRKKRDPKGKAGYSSSPASSHLLNWDKIQQTMVGLLGKGAFVVLAGSESSLSSWLDVFLQAALPPSNFPLCSFDHIFLPWLPCSSFGFFVFGAREISSLHFDASYILLMRSCLHGISTLRWFA